jgi:hypothetical protein
MSRILYSFLCYLVADISIVQNGKLIKILLLEKQILSTSLLELQMFRNTLIN